MGLVGLLKFALKNVTWPLVALAYPLWVSIQVIETKSNALMQKLIAYWISFSVILLFEHAFGKLIEWLSFWCYIRLLIIIFLVMHEFAGSLYVYEHIVCPCLSVNLETLNMVVNKAKKPFNKKDTFLTQLEKYVNENGTEAVENLIAAKVGSHPGNDKNKINTVTKVEQFKLAEPKVESKDISFVEATDKKEGTSTKPVPQNENGAEALENLIATKIGSHTGNYKNKINTVTKVEQPKLAEPKVESKDIRTVEAIDKKEGSSIKRISLIEPKLASAKTNAFAPPNPIGIPIQAKECFGLQNKPFPRDVQKGWTCALCCVTTTSESDLASHLQGKRHRAALEDSPWWCVICNIKCSSQANFDAHLNGSKHLARIKGANKV